MLSPTSSDSILNKLWSLQVGFNHSLDLQSRMSTFHWYTASTYLENDMAWHCQRCVCTYVTAAHRKSKCAVPKPNSPCPQHPCHPLQQCALLPSVDFDTAAQHQVILQLNCNTSWHVTKSQQSVVGIAAGNALSATLWCTRSV